MDPALRPLRPEDIPAWAGMLAAVEAVEPTGDHYSEADLAEELANPDLDPGKDVMGLWSQGTLLGYFLVYPRGTAEGFGKAHVEGQVHPAHRGRGHGTRLVDAMLARAAQVHRERCPTLPMKLMLTGSSAKADQERLLHRAGFVSERWTFTMRVDLADPRPAGRVPVGYAVREYEPALDAAMREAHNTAFLAHPNFTPWSAAMWRQWVAESRSFRPGLSFLVVPESAPQQVVGYLQTSEYDAYQAATGRREAFVAKVGTLREHRGHGIAGALLRHALAAYRAAGYDEASLAVDSMNPTGALGVYERAGFAVERRFTNYTKVLAPAVGAGTAR